MIEGAVLEDVRGFLKGRVILTAAELDLFTRLDKERATAEDLAKGLEERPHVGVLHGARDLTHEQLDGVLVLVRVTGVCEVEPRREVVQFGRGRALSGAAPGGGRVKERGTGAAGRLRRGQRLRVEARGRRREAGHGQVGQLLGIHHVEVRGQKHHRDRVLS